MAARRNTIRIFPFDAHLYHLTVLSVPFSSSLPPSLPPLAKTNRHRYVCSRVSVADVTADFCSGAFNTSPNQVRFVSASGRVEMQFVRVQGICIIQRAAGILHLRRLTRPSIYDHFCRAGERRYQSELGNLDHHHHHLLLTSTRVRYKEATAAVAADEPESEIDLGRMPGSCFPRARCVCIIYQPMDAAGAAEVCATISKLNLQRLLAHRGAAGRAGVWGDSLQL